MAGHDKKQGQTDDVISFPDNRCSATRQFSDRPVVEIIEEESVIPIDHLLLADAKLKAHQAEVLIASCRDETLQILKEAGFLEDEQVEIDPGTGDCFILADGKLMGLSAYITYVKEKRLQEEADRFREESSQKSD